MILVYTKLGFFGSFPGFWIGTIIACLNCFGIVPFSHTSLKRVSILCLNSFGQFLIISYVVESFPGADLPLFSRVASSSAIVMAVLSLFVGSWACNFSFSFWTLFLYFLNSSSRFSSLDINSYCCARTSALSSLFIVNSFVLSFSIGTLIVDFFLMPLILLI